uniref:Uncharacterized protein n=1 Tax=Bicosoecida sp. CB-2014 TaxID=1486930 RepID=A0A7S1CIJ0_9STRA|mmetsp:Transcript_28029/g.96920  ORF Transcript_28029/g.96920 Transcript_28029/m.96920 type:complete len:120 (+) Transcript_28029:212-571(+)
MTSGLSGMVIIPAMCCAWIVGIGIGVLSQFAAASAGAAALAVVPVAAAGGSAVAVWWHRKEQPNAGTFVVREDGSRDYQLARVAATFANTCFWPSLLVASAVAAVALVATAGDGDPIGG